MARGMIVLRQKKKHSDRNSIKRFHDTTNIYLTLWKKLDRGALSPSSVRWFTPNPLAVLITDLGDYSSTTCRKFTESSML